MTNSITIRLPLESDFDDWCTLYHGYAEFYKVPMTDAILNRVWGWIHDPQNSITCLLAISPTSNKPCGLAHVREMPSPLRGALVGFLDDMFILPSERGNGISKALFAALEIHARENGWPLIRWITADDNYRARGLYDQISSKTMWNTYQMDIAQG